MQIVEVMRNAKCDTVIFTPMLTQNDQNLKNTAVTRWSLRFDIATYMPPPVTVTLSEGSNICSTTE